MSDSRVLHFLVRLLVKFLVRLLVKAMCKILIGVLYMVLFQVLYMVFTSGAWCLFQFQSVPGSTIPSPSPGSANTGNHPSAD